MRKRLWAALIPAVIILLIIGGCSRKPRGYDLSRSQEMAFAVMSKFNCVNCHTIDGAPGNKNAMAAPRLNQIGLRRSKEWIMRWMEDPPAMKPGTVMPIYPLTREQRESIADYLLSLSKPVNAQVILAKAKDPEEAGKQLMAAYDCLACHSIKGNPASMGRRVGPDLTHIASEETVTDEKWSQEWETAWLRDPAAKKPGTFMPKFNLTDEEIQAIVAYLKALK